MRVNVPLHCLFVLLGTLVPSCNPRHSNDAYISQMVLNWDKVTKRAIDVCHDSLAVRRALSMIRFANKLKLRDSVLLRLNDLLARSEIIYVIEAESGDPPRYNVMVKNNFESTIYVFAHDPEIGRLMSKSVLEQDEQYEWYSKSFFKWGEFVDTATPEQQVFWCGEKYLRKEPYFYLTFDLTKF